MSKRKVTVTLEPEVVEALDPLRVSLESQAHGALAQDSLRALHGPVRYSRSAVIQLAILSLCAKQAVQVNWRRKGVGTDISTGEGIPIPEGAIIPAGAIIESEEGT